MPQIQERPTGHRRHPRLLPHAPVVTRSDQEFQVGLDPSNALIFSGVGYGALLAALDGSRSAADARAIGRAAGLTRREVDQAIRTMTDAELLGDRRSSPENAFAHHQVRLIGAGPIGQQIGRLLVASGIGGLHVFDDEPPERDLYPTAGVLGSRSESLRAMLAEETTRPVSSLSHWSRPEGSSIDLTVVVADGPEIDRAIPDHFVRLDQPHLIVRTLGNGACVGPLVLPGRTACLRCHDLARRDADPHWPVVLDQLTRVRIAAPVAVAAWAASYATAQILAFLHGGPPELAGATTDLLAPEFGTRLRFWPAHASCGCSWLGPTEWGHD